MANPTTVTITRADGSTYTQTRVNGGYYNQEATTPSGEPVITVYKPSSGGGNSSFYGADTKTIQSQPTPIVETQKETPKETPNFFELAGKELRSKGSYAPTIKQVSRTQDLTGIEDLQNKQSYYIRSKDYQATENLNVGTSSASALAKARRDKEEKERNLSFTGLATGADVTSAKPTTMKVNDLGYLDIQEKKSVLGSRERVEQERLGSKIMDIKKVYPCP